VDKKKLIFHLLDLTILSLYTVCKFYGGNITSLIFKEELVRDFVVFHKKTQQFRRSDELTCSKAFLAVASQRKGVSCACYLCQMKSKWKSIALLQEV
jgi:hypothetical protein